MYAQRGTLSFFWRSHTPAGETPFVIFRVGFADHSSWDMAFLRIDWNGHGYEAFVTDANLARHRISWTTAAPDPDAWQHIAFGWDETKRSEEHTSELQSLMRISYAVFCLKKQTKTQNHRYHA